MGSSSFPLLAAFSVDNETRTTAGLLRHGLALLQSTGPANDNYHLHLLLLSSGFERLLKLLLIFAAAERGSSPPDLKSHGHGVAGLVDRVVETVFDDSYRQRPAAASDETFLRSDGRFREVMDLLGEFASRGRYHDLDATRLNTVPETSPEDRWRRVRDAGVDPLASTSPQDWDTLYDAMNATMVASFERGIRALTRLMTLSRIAPVAKPFHAPFFSFTALRDSELGSRDYRRKLFS